MEKTRGRDDLINDPAHNRPRLNLPSIMRFTICRFSSLALSLALTVVIVLGCGAPIQVPASDSTPPEVSLTFSRLESSIVTLEEGDAERTYTLQAPVNREIPFIATARDEDGGVHRATVHTLIGWRCENRDTTITNAGGHGPESNIDNAQPGDDAKTVLAATVNIDASEVHTNCQNGATFLGASYEISASGENFHGGIARTPSVIINVTPQ